MPEYRKDLRKRLLAVIEKVVYPNTTVERVVDQLLDVLDDEIDRDWDSPRVEAAEGAFSDYMMERTAASYTSGAWYTDGNRYSVDFRADNGKNEVFTVLFHTNSDDICDTEAYGADD